MTPAFEELDKSIEESKRSAEIFLNAVWTIGWIAALVVAIYIVPEVAEQKLSTISNARSEAQAEYRDQVRAYERKFGKKFEPVSHDECEARKKKGITDEISLANCAIRYD